MPTANEVTEFLKNATAEQFGVSINDINDDLVFNAHGDSLDHVELTFAIEDKYDVEISDEDYAAAATFGHMRNLVTANLKARGFIVADES